MGSQGAPSQVKHEVKTAFAALTGIGLSVLMWIPATILALLLVWAILAPSDVPIRRLERLVRAVRRQSPRRHRAPPAPPASPE